MWFGEYPLVVSCYTDFVVNPVYADDKKESLSDVTSLFLHLIGAVLKEVQYIDSDTCYFEFANGKRLVISSRNIGKRNRVGVFEIREQDKDVNIEVKQYRQKRSINANNYAWELITKIADKMLLSKEDVYLRMLKEYGQSEMISVLSHIDISPYLKYFEQAGTSTLNGKEFTHYKVYKGSSEFDTREMSIFIDGIVQEAKNLDIETMTPNQIAEMESEWNEYKRSHKI
jgi:hypothetical protein